MTGKSDTVAWDTCIFLAWLKDEKPPQRAPGDMEGIAQCLEGIENNRLSLIASTLIFSEIFTGNLSQEVRDQFTAFRERSNVEIISADEPVNLLAGELREFYLNKDDIKPLSLPDAIHLATAIIYNVKAFYTFDENGSSKFCGLTPLSGNVAGHELLIQKPPFIPPPPPKPMQFNLWKPNR
jgi:predicted nucleic acid-binding protein